MSVTFAGGPADGRECWLQRAPLFLRIVVDRRAELKRNGKPPAAAIDALDLLDDEPRPHEDVYVYRCAWSTPPAHICMRGRGCHTSVSAAYHYVDDVDAQELGLGDTETWREWAEREGNRVHGITDLRTIRAERDGGAA